MVERQEEVWTAEDEVVFRPLYQKWQRIRSRNRVDVSGRRKRYGARSTRKNDALLTNGLLGREGASETGQ